MSDLVFTVRAMSLTQYLDDASSPLRRFLDSELPDMSAVRRTVRLPDASRTVPVAVAGEKVPLGTIGVAIDHRLRFGFSAACLPDPARTDAPRGPLEAGHRVARHGCAKAGLASESLSGDAAQQARAMARAYGAAADLGARLFTRLAEVVDRHRPADRRQPLTLGRDAEESLCRLSYAVAWYDQLYRMRSLVRHTELRHALTACTTVEDVLATVPAVAIADMTALLTLASDGPLSRLRAATTVEDVVCGPRLAGADDVGGADADLIAGRVLVEVKTTIRPAPLSDLRQLAGYLLLDYHDDYDIDRVALFYSRHNTMRSWTVPEFLSTAGTTKPLAQLRADCASVLGRPDDRRQTL